MENQKSILNNYWFLAVIMFAISMLATIILRTFGVSSVSGMLGAFAGAWILGSIYSNKFKIIMPNGLRMKTLVVYICTRILIILLFYPYFFTGDNKFDIILIGITIFELLIQFLIASLAIGYSGKIYVNATQKSQK